MMLSDVIAFIKSRTGLVDRNTILREINYAIAEIWNTDDLPNSVQEMTVRPITNQPIVSLPYYVGTLRAVKQNWGKLSVALNTPRPYYDDGTWFQSPFTWRLLGTHPFRTSITNASIITLSIAEAESEDFTVALIGPTDNADEEQELITFEAGQLTRNTTKRFTDVTAFTKNVMTTNNVVATDVNGVELGHIPNNFLEAKNTILQIMDKSYTVCQINTCYDILFKRTAPVYYLDNSVIPFAEVLMNKIMEWVKLPQEGQESVAIAFGDKARTLLTAFNNNEGGIDHRIKVANNPFTTRYVGLL